MHVEEDGQRFALSVSCFPMAQQFGSRGKILIAVTLLVVSTGNTAIGLIPLAQLTLLSAAGAVFYLENAVVWAARDISFRKR